jgi:hypothetical protein
LAERLLAGLLRAVLRVEQGQALEQPELVLERGLLARLLGRCQRLQLPLVVD